MHIVDGALSAPVLAMGGAAAFGGCALGLKKMDMDHIPQVGLLTAAFFLASLIHVPIGLSSVHLILNGMVGLILGWTAFPALLVGLLLQAVFFGFGGVVVLGVNVVNIALPAVAVHYLFKRRLGRAGHNGSAFFWGFCAGGLAIVLTTGLVAVALAFSGEEFLPAAQLVFYAHVPVMVLEGFLTGAAVTLISRVRPEMFHLPDHLQSTEPSTTAAVRRGGPATAAILAFLLLPATGHTHNIIADAYVEGEVIEGEVGFSNGDPVFDAPVTVTDPDGAVLGTTRTDADGIFIFKIEKTVDHHFAINAGAGHVVQVVVTADQLSPRDPVPPAVETAKAAPTGTVSAAATASPAMDAAAFRAMVEKAVARQVKPLRKQLLEYENTVRLHDILGGLGYILGLTGLGMWFSARRRGDGP